MSFRHALNEEIERVTDLLADLHNYLDHLNAVLAGPIPDTDGTSGTTGTPASADDKFELEVPPVPELPEKLPPAATEDLIALDVITGLPTWARPADVRAATDWPPTKVSKVLKRLVENEHLVAEGKAPHRLYTLPDHTHRPKPDPTTKPSGKAPSAALTTSDETGAKTEVERQIVRAVTGTQLTVREVADACSLSTTSVTPILNTLVSRGCLDKEDSVGGALFSLAE